MKESGKSPDVGHNGSYGTVAVGSISVTPCTVDSKVAVLDEGQPLLSAPTIEVKEVLGGDLDEVREPPNEHGLHSNILPAKSIERGLTFKRLSLRLFLPFLLYCLAVGAVAAPKITIILALLCRKASSNLYRGKIQNDDVCAIPSVHVDMSRFMVYANLISGVLCALSGPQICRWSDRYGRKPLIAVSVAGMLLGDMVSMLAASFPDRIAVYWILTEFVFGGLTGAFFTTVALMQSYLADIAHQDQRTAAFGVLHACMFLGLGLGPGAGALCIRLVGKGDMLSVFYIAGACHLVFVLYVLFFIPESLSAAARKMKYLEDAEESSGLATGRIYCILNHQGSLRLFQQAAERTRSRQTTILRTLAGIDFLAFGVQVGLPPLLVVYSQFRFDWKTVEASFFLSVTNITRGMVLAIILPLSMRFLRSRRVTKMNRISMPVSDCQSYMHVIRISIVLEILGQVGFAMSASPASFLLSGVVTAAGAPISPVVQSIMTFYVDPSSFGELFGALTLLHSVARACMPALMQTAYGLTVRNASSVLYWGLSVVFGGAFLASLWIHYLQSCQTRPSNMGV